MEDDSSLLFLVFCVVVATLLYALCIMSSIAIANSRKRRLDSDDSVHGMGTGSARVVLEQAEFYIIAAQLGTFLSPLLAPEA